MQRTIHGRPRLPATEMLVVEALTFLGDDPERLERFLASSGLGIGELRRVATTPDFAESLLDHLCADERLLVAFAESKSYDPAAIEQARRALAPRSHED